MSKNDEPKSKLKRRIKQNLDYEPKAKKNKFDEASSWKTLECVPDKADKNNLCDFDTVDCSVLHNYISRIFEFEETCWKLPLFSDQKIMIQQTLPSNEQQKKKQIVTKDKTPLQILHEYGQRILRETVDLKKLNIELLLDNCVETIIGDRKYAIAIGDTSKKARQLSAATTLYILDPSITLDDNYKDVGNHYPKVKVLMNLLFVFIVFTFQSI